MPDPVPSLPLVVDDSGELSLFLSVAAASRDLEAVDVRDGAYEAFAADGRRIALEVDDDAVRLRLDPAGGDGPDELARRLRAYVAQLGPDLRGGARVDELEPGELLPLVAELQGLVRPIADLELLLHDGAVDLDRVELVEGGLAVPVTVELRRRGAWLPRRARATATIVVPAATSWLVSEQARSYAVPFVLHSILRLDERHVVIVGGTSPGCLMLARTDGTAGVHLLLDSQEIIAAVGAAAEPGDGAVLTYTWTPLTRPRPAR